MNNKKLNPLNKKLSLPESDNKKLLDILVSQQKLLVNEDMNSKRFRIRTY